MEFARWKKPVSAFVVCLGLVASFAGAAQANLITNGSFETGTFAGWTPVGNQTFNGVQCPGPSSTVSDGNCSAFFGPVGTTGGIEQSMVTVPSSYYVVSFDFLPDGGAPSSFLAEFGGNTLVSLTNPPAGPYIPYVFTVQGSGALSTLRFTFRDDPGFLFLDHVQVEQAVPEPATWSLLGLGLAGLVARRRARQ